MSDRKESPATDKLERERRLLEVLKGLKLDLGGEITLRKEEDLKKGRALWEEILLECRRRWPEPINEDEEIDEWDEKHGSYDSDTGIWKEDEEDGQDEEDEEDEDEDSDKVDEPRAPAFRILDLIPELRRIIYDFYFENQRKSPYRSQAYLAWEQKRAQPIRKIDGSRSSGDWVCPKMRRRRREEELLEMVYEEFTSDPNFMQHSAQSVRLARNTMMDIVSVTKRQRLGIFSLISALLLVGQNKAIINWTQSPFMRMGTWM
jgi:hypothetical protein